MSEWDDVVSCFVLKSFIIIAVLMFVCARAIPESKRVKLTQ